MTIGVIAMAQVECHSPSQQMRLRCLAGAERLEPGSRPVRGAKQLARPQAGRVLRLDQHEPSVGLPPCILLRPEETVRSLCPVKGGLRLRRGQRAVGRHQKQFGLLGGPAMGPLDITYRIVRLGQRVAGQPGRQQHSGPLEAESWRRNIKRPVAGGSLLEVRKRHRKVS
jgi:hypothetical protein